MDSSKKTVLMVQPSKNQGQIWQAALTSQGLSVIWEAANVDLVQVLEQMRACGLRPPDLILVDLAAQNVSPYAFCRWCRDNAPELRVVLTNSSQREISQPEHDWAVYQGAKDLLPGFQRQTLLTGVTSAVSRVLEILELPLIRQEPLIQILFSITSTPVTAKPTTGAPITGSPISGPLTGPVTGRPETNGNGSNNGQVTGPPTEGKDSKDSKENNPPKRRYRGAFY